MITPSPTHPLTLDGIAEGSAWLDVEPTAGAVRDLIYGVRFAQPPDAGALITLLHRRLTPFDEALDRRDLRREEKLWPAGKRS